MSSTRESLISQVLETRKASTKAGRAEQEAAAVVLMKRASVDRDLELALQIADKFGSVAYKVAKEENWKECLAPKVEDYDLILVNTSAGKDSQTTMDVVVKLAEKAGVKGRVHAVHADLGRMDWSGTLELAQQQADAYGIPLHVIKRPQGDLPTHIEQRGMFPSSACRYCTSDHKRSQVQKVITELVKGLGIKGRRARVLNCMGIRAEESIRRATFAPFMEDTLNTNQTKRLVHKWYPIFDWTLEQVWANIRKSGVPHHWAYDIGMPRLSCNFCFFVPTPALIMAGHHNRATLVELIRIEEKIGHTLRQNHRLSDILAAVDRGEKPVLNTNMEWVD